MLLRIGWAVGAGTYSCHWVRSVHAPLKSSLHRAGALPDVHVVAWILLMALEDLHSEGQRKELLADL